jgi:hypothetical protein
MKNVNSVNELKSLLTEENIKNCRYVEFTIFNDDQNYLSVFASRFSSSCRKLVSCEVISDDEVIDNYCAYTLNDLIRQIVIDFEMKELEQYYN